MKLLEKNKKDDFFFNLQRLKKNGVWPNILNENNIRPDRYNLGIHINEAQKYCNM